MLRPSLPSDLPTAVQTPLNPQCPQSKEISRPASALYCIIINVTFCDVTLQHHFCLSHIAHVSLVVFGVRICYFWECHKRAFCRTPFSAVTFPSTLSPYFLVMFVRSFVRSLLVRPSGFFSPFFSIQSSLSLAPLPSQMSTFVYVNQPSCYPTESERAHSPSHKTPR